MPVPSMLDCGTGDDDEAAPLLLVRPRADLAEVEPPSADTLPLLEGGPGAAKLIVVVGGEVDISGPLLPPLTVALVLAREACGLEGGWNSDRP